MAIEKKNAWEKYPQGPEREKIICICRGLQKVYIRLQDRARVYGSSLC